MIDFEDSLTLKLKGKKILFIGVKFYHFNDEIINKLNRIGSEVHFFHERNVSIKYGLAKNFFPKHVNSIQDNHYQHILRKVGDKKFDYLFVIRGYKMEPWFIEKLKANSPNLYTILYQWDSVTNWECDYRYLIPYFDSVKTFDYKDSLDLNLEYVPTFHTDEFASIKTVNPEYDLFYFGGYSTPRYEFLKRIKSYAKENNIKLKSHLAISLKYFLKEWLSGRKLDASLLSFKKLNKQEYLRLFKASNIIVDYANEMQTGITMRSLDALGAGKKILTSNEYIKNEPGYNPNQIQIFNPAHINIDHEFLSNRSFPNLNYSIEKWLDKIF